MIEPEAIAARSLRELLLRELPQALVTLNAARAPVLRAPLEGPYAIPAGAVLRLRGTGASFVNVPLTQGAARTAAQVATDVGVLVAGVTASADARGRLVLTGAAPSSGEEGVELDSEANAEAASGTYAVFGFNDGGNAVWRSAVLAPGYRNVYDGFPLSMDFAGNGALNVVVGDRRSRPSGNFRRHMWDVELDVLLYRAEPSSRLHGSREGAQACLAAVRALLVASRKLDEADTSPSSVMLVQESSAEVLGQPVVFEGLSARVLFDRARITLTVRVFAT